MRYRPEHKEKTRGEMLTGSGRAFREKGYAGVGVDELAAAAGLTSGALYKHFGSKNALFREIVRAGMERLRDGINRFQQRAPQDWLASLAAWYMGSDHRIDIGGGCALPSLSSEVAKAGPEVRAVYEAGLRAAVDALTAAAPFDDGDAGRARAWATLALLAGGVTLSRAVADPALADEISRAVRSAMVQLPE